MHWQRHLAAAGGIQTNGACLFWAAGFSGFVAGRFCFPG